MKFELSQASDAEVFGRDTRNVMVQSVTKTLRAWSNDRRMVLGICVECEKLLREANEAVNLRSNKVSEIANIVGNPRRKPNAEEFAVFENQMRECYLEAQAAWDRYWKHVELHRHRRHWHSRQQRELRQTRQSLR